MSNYLIEDLESEEELTEEEHIAIAQERWAAIQAGELKPVVLGSTEFRDFLEELTADFTWWDWKKLDISLWWIKSPVFRLWMKFKYFLYKMLG